MKRNLDPNFVSLTPAQSPTHILLDVISISPLITPDPGIVLVNNDLN